MSKLSVAFTPDEAVEATKDFVGQIVAAEYGLGPLGMTGRPDLEQRAQMAIQIRTEEYEKDQYELSTASKDLSETFDVVECVSEGYKIGFAEAAIDMEGSISLVRAVIPGRPHPMYIPRVTIVSTDLRILERCKAVFGRGSISNRSGSSSDWTKKKLMQYDMDRTLMREILPILYLASKEKQKVLLLEALEITGGVGSHNYRSQYDWDRLEGIYWEMRELNGTTNYKYSSKLGNLELFGVEDIRKVIVDGC